MGRSSLGPLWAVAFDRDAGAIYAGGASGVLKSTLLVDAKGTILVVGDAGVLASRDGGENWSEVEWWLPSGDSIAVVTANLQEPETLYVGSSRGEVWRSNDGGRRWTRRAALPIVHALECHPMEPTVVYACTDDGLLRSVDAAQSWQHVHAGRVWSVAVHAGPPLTIYTGSNGVCRSIDGGATWKCAELGER
jgi:photosystem II stability/assembly factor-like uncharacterized protein